MTDTPVLAHRLDVIFLRLTDPFPDAYHGLPRPSKRSRRHALITAVHAHGVVRRRSAEPVPPPWVGDIGVGSRIDQDLAVTTPHDYAERIGVAVAGVPCSKRTGIHEDIDIAGAQHRQSRIRKVKRPRRIVTWASANLQCFRSNPPQRLLINVAGGMSRNSLPQDYRASGQSRTGE